LAAALHDSVCQTLFGIQLMISRLAPALGDAPDAKERLELLRGHVTTAITEARSITARLSPRGIQDLGLATALGDAATDLLNGCPIDVELQDHSADVELPADRRMLAFRCVQELLRNIRKHANARSVVIELESGEGVLCITVRDDGDGFDPATALDAHQADCGFGLFSIIERISFSGGTVTIDSAPGAGSTITLNIPVGSEEASP
jgi:signal transduction histidine kinase